MKKLAAIAIVALFTLAGQASAGQPELVKAKINPEVAAIGDDVTVSVEFTGNSADLEKVYLKVREYPYEGPTIYLKPAEGEKNVWTALETVPWDAPAETFNLDINAVDIEGKELVTEGFENNATGKAGSVQIEVTY